MRRLVVVMIAVSMLLTLTACGGGGDNAGTTTQSGEVATQTQADKTSTAAAPGATTPSVVSSNTLSPQEAQKFEPFPTDKEVLPDQIKQRLDAKRPMLVYFYDTTQRHTDDARAQIDKVLGDYRGLIDLVAFDVSKYVTTDASGSVLPKPGIADDPTAQQVAMLLSSNYLNVRYTPYLVFVDRQGYIIYRFSGMVDADLLERQVLRATE